MTKFFAQDDHWVRCSPEAVAARAAYAATPDVAAAVSRRGSGVELRSGGFGVEIEVACEFDTASGVPVMIDGGFAPQRPV